MTSITERARQAAAGSFGRGLTAAIAVALGVTLYSFPSFAQGTCPTTPAEMSTELLDEDAAARAEAAQCFIESAVLFDYPDLKQVVNKMLNDDSADVRFYGLGALQASAWAALTTGSDLRNEKAKIMQVLNEDPVARNKAAAAYLIAQMDPIPVNQAQEPLLDLLGHADVLVVEAALAALSRFDSPPEEQISQALMVMKEHSDHNHRGVALQGLGRLHKDDPSIDPAVVGAVASALGDDNRFVQWQAANSLRMFGPQAASAEPDLQAIVWDPKQPPEVRKVAQEAVESITGEPIKPPWLTGETPPPEPGMAGAPE